MLKQIVNPRPSHYPVSSHRQSRREKLGYFRQSLYGHLFQNYYPKDEWGVCCNCGKFTRFSFHPMITVNSKIAQSCGWDEHYVEEINLTNTLNCQYCYSKFRVRCAIASLLQVGWQGKFRSIADLVHSLKSGQNDNWLVLETASTGGIFSDYDDLKQVIKSEYYDDIPRGSECNGIRSEDLTHLTFDENTLDTVISLDVFEHIADPWKAFLEVVRVLKPGGLGIITVPIDRRTQKTLTLATLEHGKIKHFRESPAYHVDPLREEGALVFTEFGTDIVDRLRAIGCHASLKCYSTKRSQAHQFVILLHKPPLSGKE